MVIFKEARRILVWVCVFMFISCNPEKKLQKAITTLSSNPEKSAAFCADRYPVKELVIYRDSITLDTIFLELERVDTLYQNDTCYIITTSPNKIITKTVTKYKEVQVENTARIQEKEKLYQACEKNYHDLYTKLELTEADKRGWRSKFWWVLFVAIGAIVGYLTKQPWWATLLKQIQKQVKK